MDPQTLPAEAQAIYRRIKEQYKVSFDSLRLADDLRLHLLMLTDLEQLLAGADPLKHPEKFPLWIKLWEAAVVLASFVVSLRPVSGNAVLELGAGLGVPGLAAAALGCDVTLTDSEQLALDLARVSAVASGLETVRFELLNWLSPPPAMEHYDLILGAEIIFREELFEPLLAIMRQALKPEGTIYLAHDSRRQSLRPFLVMAEQEYVISVRKQTLKSLAQNQEIILTRLVRR